MVASIIPLIALSFVALSVSASSAHSGLHHAHRRHTARPARALQPAGAPRALNSPRAADPAAAAAVAPADIPRRRKRNSCTTRPAGSNGNGGKHSSSVRPSATASGDAPAASQTNDVPPANDGSRVFKLQEKWAGKNFFDGFTFWDFADPTHGNVDYVGADEAFSSGLAYVNDAGVAVMSVDTKSYVPENGQRKSVRIHSKNSFDSGLIIADIAAMPHGASVWPAWWMNGPNWPAGGEIDVLEGVHDQTQNHMTLHTSPGCTLDASKSTNDANLKSGTSPVAAFFGQSLRTDCNAYADGNSGCGIMDPSTQSYGHNFNVAGGAVFATLIDDSGVRIWRFNRDSVPADITSNPNPATWGTPQAFWASDSCRTPDFFKAQTLIFNITLCGDWAGATFNQAGYSGSCGQFVMDPKNYPTANWQVNYVAVYN